MSNITTIAELKEAWEYVPPKDTTDAIVTNNYTLMNDLDFNNEHYWYKEENFFYCNHISIFEDTPIKTENKNFYLNDKTLSNIYLYDSIKAFVLDSYDKGTNTTYNINFYDGTFEVVSNFGTLFEYGESTLPSGAGNNNNLTTILQFNNCIFNVKSLGADGHVNLQPRTLFQNSKACKIKLKFINCVFNIEYTPKCVNTSGIIVSRSSSDETRIESCEFRIRDRSTSRYTASNGNAVIAYAYSQKLTANNNVIFYDATASLLSTYTVRLWYNSSSSAASCSNNFLAAFDNYSTPINFDSTHNNSIFYDNEKFTNTTGSGTVVVGLSTANCKDEQALEAAGYVFANES
jgi:hypothetical protein